MISKEYKILSIKIIVNYSIKIFNFFKHTYKIEYKLNYFLIIRIIERIILVLTFKLSNHQYYTNLNHL